MKFDTEGFGYPNLDTSICIGCGRCERVCPVMNIKCKELIMPETYTCRNLDESVRQHSSSGGLFYAMAMAIIHQAGVIFGERFEMVHISIIGKLRGKPKH